MSAIPVDECGPELDAQAYAERFLAQNRPVVVRGALDSTATFSRAALRGSAGHIVVPVICAPEGNSRLDTQTGRPLHGCIERTLADFLDEGASNHLIQQLPLATLPDFLAQLSAPRIKPDITDAAAHLWISPAGSSSALHFDTPENLLLQFEGRKAVRLYSPEQTPWLYPHPASGTGASRSSQLELTAPPDPERYPLFTRAQCLEAEIAAGDLIYVPAFWWHFVETIESSVSINLWWGDSRVENRRRLEYWAALRRREKQALS